MILLSIVKTAQALHKCTCENFKKLFGSRIYGKDIADLFKANITYFKNNQKEFFKQITEIKLDKVFQSKYIYDFFSFKAVSYVNKHVY